MHSRTLLARKTTYHEGGTYTGIEKVAGTPPGATVTIFLGREEGVWPSSDWRVVEPPLTVYRPI